MVLNEYKVCFRDTEIVAKDILKEYTSIGTNKITGTLMSAF